MLILPNRFQLRIVENAKKNRQIANTVPNAHWARFVLLKVLLSAAAPQPASGPSPA